MKRVIFFLTFLVLENSGWANNVEDSFWMDDGRPGFEGGKRILVFPGTLHFTPATGDAPETLVVERGDRRQYSLYKEKGCLKKELNLKLLKDHGVFSLPDLSGKKVYCQSQSVTREGKITLFARYVKPVS